MEYMRITSSSNPHIRELIHLRNKPVRGQRVLFLIEGIHLLEAALSAGSAIREVYFTGDFSLKKAGHKILRILSKKGVAMYEVSESVLRKLSDTETPQGVVSLVAHAPLMLNDLPLKKDPLLAVIDGIQDPGNLGTIIRTSDAAGADAVVLLPGTCDAFMPKVIRSTAGSIFHIPVLHTDAPSLKTWLHEKGIRLAGTSAGAGESVFDAELRGSIALLFGNEARGVGEDMRKSADILLRVPVYGRAESLNVAAAAAICLYEAVRQRIHGGAERKRPQ